MLGLLVASLGLFFALGTDVVASRSGASRIVVYMCSFVTGFATVLAALVMLPLESPWTAAAVAALAYAAWWFAFLNLVQALESSLRVKLLAEVRGAGGRVPLSFFEGRYNDARLLGLRLDRLRAHGAIVERNGRFYVISPGLKFLANFFRVLKRALIGRISEFEERRR
jgi:hypothetical protein